MHLNVLKCFQVKVLLINFPQMNLFGYQTKMISFTQSFFKKMLRMKLFFIESKSMYWKTKLKQCDKLIGTC